MNKHVLPSPHIRIAVGMFFLHVVAGYMAYSSAGRLSPDEKASLEMLDFNRLQLRTALENGAAEDLLPFLSDSVIWMSGEYPQVLKGKTKVVDTYRRFLLHHEVRMSFQVHKVDLAADCAIEWGSWDYALRQVSTGERTPPAPTHYLIVWERSDGGQWKISKLIYSVVRS